MAYLLDTDWVIDHLEGIPAAITLLQQLAPQGMAISIITYWVRRGLLNLPWWRVLWLRPAPAAGAPPGLGASAGINNQAGRRR